MEQSCGPLDAWEMGEEGVVADQIEAESAVADTAADMIP